MNEYEYIALAGILGSCLIGSLFALWFSLFHGRKSKEKGAENAEDKRGKK